MTSVGIDVSKKTVDVTVLAENSKEKHKVFANHEDGFKGIQEWLTHLNIQQAHVCLEATGRYGEDIALFMHEHGYKVSVVNPARIKAYARSEGCRVKTDKVDSSVIARFCKAQCPLCWVPPTLAEQQLKDLYRCRQSLLKDKNRMTNRLEKLHKDKASRKIWQKLLMELERQIHAVDRQLTALLQNDEPLKLQVDLLNTIPGVSTTTACAVLAELPNVKAFNDAKEIAAFSGLTPSGRQSGSSVRGKARLSKVGNAQLRKALYMPTVVARRYNPLVKEFCRRLEAKGKPTMVILAAGMRKLLHIIFGILRTQQPFRALKMT